MNAASFDFLRRLVQQRSAIVLDDSKGYLIETRLMPLLRACSLESIDHLADLLRRTPDPELEQRVVNAMTTNETSFFRDIAVFEALRTSILPELIGRRSAQRQLSVWCAACASGQEAYSVAMLLSEHFPQLSTWQVRLLATDLSTDMLDRARQGRYTQMEVNRGLPARLLVKYFQQEGSDWCVADRLRKMIDFQPLNLAATWPALGRMDLILLRNVMVYFDLATKTAILRRTRATLDPDGYVVLGGAETTLHVDDAFERVQHGSASAYRLRKAPACAVPRA